LLGSLRDRNHDCCTLPGTDYAALQFDDEVEWNSNSVHGEFRYGVAGRVAWRMCDLGKFVAFTITAPHLFRFLSLGELNAEF
jgi:hypothetical protein